MTGAQSTALTRDAIELLDLRVGYGQLASRLSAAEQESDRLAATSVALLRLYEAASSAELLAAMRDVLVNLAGVEMFELYASPTPSAAPELVTIAGADRAELGDARFAQIAREVVCSSTPRPMVNPRAMAGRRRDGMTGPVASVPLLWHGAPMGALVIGRLLPHKPGLTPGDIELFELLATHLLPALTAADGRASGAMPRWTAV